MGFSRNLRIILVYKCRIKNAKRVERKKNKEEVLGENFGVEKELGKSSVKKNCEGDFRIPQNRICEDDYGMEGSMSKLIKRVFVG